MIDLNEIIYWSTEEYVDEIQKNNAVIRDLLNDNEQLLAAYIKNGLMTMQETADYLKCKPENIPLDIPYVRVGRDRRYKRFDVEKFLRDRKVSRKEEK